MGKVFNVSFLHAKGKNQIRDGLMYRKKKLNKNQGMLFHTGLKVSSFWMKNTFIPLDVLFLNKNGKILGYKENNKPHSLKGISIGKKSFYVLEMNGGWVKENKVKVGDKIKIRKSRTRKKRGGGIDWCKANKLLFDENRVYSSSRGNQYCIQYGQPEESRGEGLDPYPEVLPNSRNICKTPIGRCETLPVPGIGLLSTVRAAREDRRRAIATTLGNEVDQSDGFTGGARKNKTRKKRAGVKIDIGSFWTKIQHLTGDRIVWQVVGIIGEKGKVIIQVAKQEYGTTWMMSYEKENFFRLYKPFNENPGGDALPQKVPEESGGDKMGGMKKAGPATMSRAEYERRQQRRREREEELWRQLGQHRQGSEWIKIGEDNVSHYYKDEKIIYKVRDLSRDGGKINVIISFEAKLGPMVGMMPLHRVIELESFLENYKPFNDKPGGDAVPQKIPKESGGDKIGGRRRKKTRKMRGQGKKRKKEDSSGSSGSKPAKKQTSTPQVDERNKCGVCLKVLRISRTDDAVIHCPACNGIFCKSCLSAWMCHVLPQVAKCPLCNALLSEETYTCADVPYPNQANNNNNVNITALDVNQLYPIVNPTMVTGNQGEREIQNMLRALISNIGPQGNRETSFEIMSAVRFAITRAEQVAQHLGGNYDAITNRTPFLQALNADWAALGGHGYYRYLNAFTGIASIGMEPQIQPNELQLHTQNRQQIEDVVTIQDLYNIINQTITQYEAGPGATNAQATPFYQALRDDIVFLEVFL